MNTPFQIRAIALDFDNCIALSESGEGSEEVKDRAWFEVFSEIERTRLSSILEAVTQNIAGGKGDRRDIIRRVLADCMPAFLTAAEIERRAERFNRIVQEGITRVQIPASTRETLALLARRFPLYVNTATPRDAAIESISALELHSYFKAVLGRPGMKADNLRSIIHVEKIQPSELLFVDDQQSGWEAAQEGDCRFIGIRTRRNTRWSTPQPFTVISSLSELPRFVLVAGSNAAR